MTSNIDDEIRDILVTHGRLSPDLGTISDHDDLFDAGMTSHANVNVMLALEDTFDIEFPEQMLQRSTFQSLAAIRAAVAALQSEQVASLS